MPSPQLPDSLTVETVRIRSGVSNLEGELAYPDEAAPGAAVMIAGPHPLLGGSMDNNVVRSLGEGLARRGIATLRFNYRGVGGSEGQPIGSTDRLAEFWQTSRLACESDFQTDLRSAADFLRTAISGPMKLALLGYSFGCSLLADPELVAEASALVLVAPTLDTHDYHAFEGIAKPKLVIAPAGDFAANSDHVRRWFDRLIGIRKLLEPDSDGHFFRGHEDWLVAQVTEFLLDQNR